MKTKRHYGNDDKALALAVLAAHAGNLARTARQLGIPRNTLRRWVEGQERVGPFLVSQIKTLLAAALWRISQNLVEDLLDPDRIAQADLQQVAIALGIVVDKALLLRGLPHSITASQGPLDHLGNTSFPW